MEKRNCRKKKIVDNVFQWKDEEGLRQADFSGSRACLNLLRVRVLRLRTVLGEFLSEARPFFFCLFIW